MPHNSSSNNSTATLSDGESLTAQREFTIHRDDFHVTLPVEHARTQDLLWELADVIRSEWMYPTRTRIDQVKPGTGRGTLIIEWEDSGDERVLGGLPAALLKHGWAITGLKTRYTFVSPVHPSVESDVTYRFESDTGDPTYSTKPCEICGEREMVDHAEVYCEPANLEQRIENNEYIPMFWSRYIRICDDCEIPDHLDEYEHTEEPDFNADEYPDYNPWGTDDTNDNTDSESTGDSTAEVTDDSA